MVTLSERQVKARGLKVETIDPTGGLFEPVDPVSGVKMPARPLMPDVGFDSNPGKSVYGGMVDAAKMGENPKAIEGLKGPDDYKRKALKNVSPKELADLDESMLLPSGKDDAWYIKKFKEKYGDEKVVTDATGEPVILSLRSFMENKERGTYKFYKPGHAETITVLGDMVEKPYEVWLTPQKDASGKIRLTKRYVCLWKTGDKKKIGGFAVFETHKGVLQGVTSFMPERKGKTDWNYLEKQRRGLLLYPKKKTGR